MQLGERAFRSVSVYNRHTGNPHAVDKGRNGHLCLYLKAGAHNRYAFDKFPWKRSVSGHDICYIAMKQEVDQSAGHAVAETVQSSFILFEVSAIA